MRNNVDINSISGTGLGGRVLKEDIISHMEGQTVEKVRSTPAVRAFAKQNGLDINQIKGTGNNGRVSREDVRTFMAGPTTAGTSVSAPSSSVAQPPLTGVTQGDQVKKISGIKKAMTKTMTQALTIPTFTYSDDIDASKTMAMRKELKAVYPDLTLLPFFIKALSLAMNEYPIINSVVNPEVDGEGYIKEYVIKEHHNFAVAIDSDHGLTTPVLKDIDNMSIL